MYLSVLGKHGVRAVAEQCYHKAHYAASRIAALPGFSLWPEDTAPPGSSPVFWNEFTVRCPAPPAEINAALLERGILGGLDRSALVLDAMTLCVTELNTRAEIDALVEALAACSSGASGSERSSAAALKPAAPIGGGA